MISLTKGLSTQRVISGLTAGLPALFATLVLIGWAIQYFPLTRLVDGWTAMNPVTAVCFLLFSLSSFLLGLGETTPRRVARVLGVLLALIGSLKILALFGWSQSIDGVLFRRALPLASSGSPNSMAPNTALGFVLLGLAVCSSRAGSPRAARFSQIASLAVLLISGLAMTGYLYKVTALYQAGRYIPMAFLTALCFGLASLGLLYEERSRGIVSEFFGPSAGAVAGRTLLPFIVMVPLCLGWLRLEGEERGLYTGAFGTTMMVVLTIVIQITVVWFLARLLTRADRRRHEAFLKLEFVNKELESFSSAVAHDLRAPLRSMMGFSEALKEEAGSKLDAGQLGYLERIQAASRKMGQLIDGLLQLSRLSRREMSQQTLSLAALSKAVVAELKSSEPGRDVLVQIEEDMPTRGDPQLISILLTNLITNAFKFTSKTDQPKIEIGTTRKNGKPIFFIKDNGAGFDMAYSQRLFGAFQRLHSGGEFPGTGIGLATVHRIVTRHGGTIWAEAEVNKGATFYFSLEN
jgi:signal transduction histidine kinase